MKKIAFRDEKHVVCKHNEIENDSIVQLCAQCTYVIIVVIIIICVYTRRRLGEAKGSHGFNAHQ